MRRACDALRVLTTEHYRCVRARDATQRSWAHPSAGNPSRSAVRPGSSLAGSRISGRIEPKASGPRPTFQKERLTMKRSASAVWKGGLQDGQGTVSTESGILSGAPYNFKMRFENEKGTNQRNPWRRPMPPASPWRCRKFWPMPDDTGKHRHESHREPDKGDAGFSVTSSHLDTTVTIPNANKAAFDEAVQKAKAGCRSPSC